MHYVVFTPDREVHVVHIRTLIAHRSLAMSPRKTAYLFQAPPRFCRLVPDCMFDVANLRVVRREGECRLS